MALNPIQRKIVLRGIEQVLHVDRTDAEGLLDWFYDLQEEFGSDLMRRTFRDEAIKRWIDQGFTLREAHTLFEQQQKALDEFRAILHDDLELEYSEAALPEVTIK